MALKVTQVLNGILQVILLVLKEVFEMKAEKRAERKALRKEAQDAFKEKDKNTRASRINSIVGKSNKL